MKTVRAEIVQLHNTIIKHYLVDLRVNRFAPFAYTTAAISFQATINKLEYRFVSTHRDRARGRGDVNLDDHF